jgi:hypothetical protein
MSHATGCICVECTKQRKNMPDKLKSCPFEDLVALELAKAKAKHKRMNSAHEGYAVILEELDELWVEIKQQNQNKDKIKKELIQVAAMCQRFWEDVLMEPEAQ